MKICSLISSEILDVHSVNIEQMRCCNFACCCYCLTLLFFSLQCSCVICCYMLFVQATSV